MANTYTQIHLQAVFSVQDRDCIIKRIWKNELYQYITGIIQNYGHKVLAINGMPDHIHVFFGMRPTQSLSDLMQDIKGDSSKCPPDQSGRDKPKKVCKEPFFLTGRVWGIFIQ
jgi:putative transposase